MNDVFIGIGSNLGNRTKNLKNAIEAIESVNGIGIKRVSSFIKTNPENAAGPKYLNAVIKIKTDLLPEKILAVLNEIEKKMGRKRLFKNSPRIIDLDILLYGNEKINTDKLIIPHPRMKVRNFVKIPLFEIEPELKQKLK